MRSVRLLAVVTLLMPTLAQAQVYSTYYGAAPSGISRASFVQMVMTQIGNPTDGTNCFTDVGTQSFASSVCAAKQRGIVTGDANGKFRPNDSISFVEAAAVALRANGAAVSYSNPWYASYLTTLSDWNAFPESVTNILYPINSSQAQELISSVFSADHSSTSHSNNSSNQTNSSSSDDNNNDDVKITVTASDSKADTGDTVTYTIKLKNEENHDLHNVDVKAYLDSDFDFVSTSDSGDYDDDQVDWEIDIDEDETETITLKLRVSSGADDNDKLDLRVRADDSEVRKTLTVDEGNSNSSNDGDLHISITDSPSTVEAGDTVTYTIKLENKDNDDMHVDVNALLDQDMDFVSASDGGSEDDNEVEWNNLFIAEDDEEVITVKVRIDNSVNDGDTVHFEVRAEGEYDSETTEVDDRNNSGSDDVSIAISDSSDPANPGETVTYTITLKNNANDDEEFDVVAELDDDMTFLSASDGGDLDNHRVEWNNFEIDDDDQEVIYLRVQISNNADDGDTLRLRVTAGDDEEEETTRID